MGRRFVPVLTSPSSLGFAHSSDVLDAWALARPGFCASSDRLSDLFCDPVYKFWSDYWCVFYLVWKIWLTWNRLRLRFSFRFRFRLSIWIFAERHVTLLPSDVLGRCEAPNTPVHVSRWIPTEVVLSDICVLVLLWARLVPVLASSAALCLVHTPGVYDAWALAGFWFPVIHSGTRSKE